MYSLHASFTLSDELIQKTREQAHQLPAPITIHTSEGLIDVYHNIERYDKRTVERLFDLGVLGPDVVLGHCVHVNQDELELIRGSGAAVAHNPMSNMNNAVGVAPVKEMYDLGIPVCLGNDGFSNSMWEEWKTAYLVHKVWHRDPRRMSGEKIVEMAIDNNAALAGLFFPEAPIGVIKPGAHADIILVDYHPTTPLTEGNLPWHILFGFHDSMVTTTIAAGRLLMRDRQLLTLNEKAISARAQEIVPNVWERYRSFVPDD